MNRIKMGKLNDLSPGKSIEKRIMARRIAVFNVGGKLYGIESDCKHMKASLQSGKVENEIVTCPWHSWQYDIKTGQCLTVDKFKLRTYEVEVDGDDVYIKL